VQRVSYQPILLCRRMGKLRRRKGAKSQLSAHSPLQEDGQIKEEEGCKESVISPFSFAGGWANEGGVQRRMG
jgi:hypothetical protein